MLLNKSLKDSVEITVNGIKGDVVKTIVFTKGQDGFKPRETDNHKLNKLILNPAEWQIIIINKKGE